MKPTFYYIYIMASEGHPKHGERPKLYTGVTNNLPRRVEEHKSHLHPRSYTARNNITRLVYYQQFTTIYHAINAEKEMKTWNRASKLHIITIFNPDWMDLDPPRSE